MVKRLSLIVSAIALAAGLFVFFTHGSDGEDARGDVAEQSEGKRPRLADGRDRDFEGVETRAAGRVTSSDGDAPVPGAIVALEAVGGRESSTGEQLTAVADGSGQWAIDGLSPGKYALSATADGFLPGTKAELKLEAGENGGLNLQLVPGGSPLKGTIADVTGGAIEGAWVRVMPVIGIGGLGKRQGFTTLSKEDGKYSVNVADGRYRVRVAHPDYGPDARTIEIRPGSRTHDFKLVPAGVIEGIVLTRAERKPVRGAKVRFVRERQVTVAPGQTMRMPGQSGEVEADEAGKFRIRGIQPGVVTLRGVAKGLTTNEAHEVPVGMAEQVTGVEVLVDSAHTLRGRVVFKDDESKGVPGARIVVMTAGAGAPGATSGPEGDFEIPALLPGRYNLTAMGDAFLPEFPGTSVDVQGDTDDVLLTVERGLTIRGRVEPATQAEVSLDLRPEKLMAGGGFGMGGGLMAMTAAGTAATDPEGNFELGPVPPGTLDLIAKAADGRVGEARVEATAGGAEVVITLENRAKVAGKVIDARGEAVADAVVSLKHKQSGSSRMTININGMDMGASSAPTSVEGTFEILGVDDGAYDLSVADARGGALAWAEADASPPPLVIANGGDQKGVVLTVESRNGVIRGTVKTAEGDPAPDVWVTATLVPEAPKPEPAEASPEGEGKRVERRSVMVIASGDNGGGGGGMGFGGSSEPPVLTDDDGTFEIPNLREGNYQLVAEGTRGGSRVTKTGVRPGHDVLIELAPLGTLEGRVTSGGQPMRNYVVTLSGPLSRTTRVRDDNGEFSMSRLDPGEYTVTIKASGGGKTVKTMVVAGETARVDVAVDEWAKVSGKVVSKTGEPIANARILMGDGDAGNVSIQLDGTEEDVRTDDEGKFETTCAAGPRVLLVMSPDSPAPLAVKPFVAQNGKTHDLGKIEEDPPEGMMKTSDEDVEEVEG